MEKLKQSEEEIIKLGKKLVEELKLDNSVNTLGRWMSHYVSELIYNAENSESEEKKKKLKKECCGIIIKLWKNKEHMPNINLPLSNLQPALKVLDALKKRDDSYQYWREYQNPIQKSNWLDFVNKVKSNSENILNRSILASLSEDILLKEREWIDEHKSMLSKEEIQAINSLDFYYKLKTNQYGDDSISIEHLAPKERYEFIFIEIEKLLDEQNKVLQALKSNIFNLLESRDEI